MLRVPGPPASAAPLLCPHLSWPSPAQRDLGSPRLSAAQLGPRSRELAEVHCWTRKSRIWGRLTRLRTEHRESLWPGSGSVSARWVGTLLQPRRSDLLSPLRPLDTSVFCPRPSASTWVGQTRGCLEMGGSAPRPCAAALGRALSPLCLPGGSDRTGAFLRRLLITPERPGSSDGHTGRIRQA